MMIPVYGTASRRIATIFWKSASLTGCGGCAATSDPTAGSSRGTLIVCGPTPKRCSRWRMCCSIASISNFQSYSPNNTPTPTSSIPASIARSGAVSRQSKSRFGPQRCTSPYVRRW